MHDVFGMPHRLRSRADLSRIERGNDLLGVGIPWCEYKRWRREVARNTASDDLGRVWCRRGDDACDEHPPIAGGAGP